MTKIYLTNVKLLPDNDNDKEKIKPILIARCRRGLGDISKILGDALVARGWIVKGKIKMGWVDVYGVPPKELNEGG